MKLIWVVVGIVLMFQLVLSVEYISHDMTILITPNKTPSIVENYQIKLDQNEIQQFREIMNNSSASELAKFGTGPSFKVAISNFHSSYKLGESGFAEVTLQYEANILHKIADNGPTEVVEITGSDTVFQGKTFTLPWKPTTQISIQFPKAYRLVVQPRPQPTLNRVIANLPGYSGEFYEYVWKGPLTSDKFVVEFERPKAMQRQFSLMGIITEFEYSLENPLYLLVIIIFLGLIVIYRKALVDLFKEIFAEEPALEEEE